jgi:hypothetical protein
MATFVVAAALVASLRHTEALTKGAAGGIGAGFRFITATSQLRRLTVASAVATLAVGLGGSTMYAVIGLGLHRPPQFAGVTQMVQGIGAIAGGLSAAAAIRRLGEVRTTVAALVVFAAAPLLVAAPSLPVVLAGNAVAGAALPWIVIAIITLLQRLAPLRLQGRVYAAFEVCATGPQTAGLAAGATLLAVLDYRAILAAESVALLLAAALLSRARTPVDALTTAAVPSPDRPRPAARPGPPPTPPGPRHLPRPSARTARSAPDRRPPADHLRRAP